MRRIIYIFLFVAFAGFASSLYANKGLSSTSAKPVSGNKNTIKNENPNVQKIKLKNDSLKKQIETLKGKNKFITDSIDKIKKQKKDYNDLVSGLKGMGPLIYGKWVNYPLSVRFNQGLIDRVRKMLIIYDELPIEKCREGINFAKSKKQYFKLLESYPKYNQEILEFINKILDDKDFDVKIKQYRDEVKGLPYYKDCYLKKKTSEFASIDYLDSIIDKLKGISGDKKTLTRKLRSLRHRLK